MWSDEEFDDNIVEPSGTNEKFLWSAMTGNIKVMKDTYDKCNSVLFVSDEDGYTALHKAASEGHKHIIEFLLSKNTDVNLYTNDRWTPLHCACKWNNVEVAHLLIQNGADINAQSNANATPLHVAAGEKNCREVLILLLNEGDINIELKNGCGDTAYDLALRCSRYSSLFDIASPHINVI